VRGKTSSAQPLRRQDLNISRFALDTCCIYNKDGVRSCADDPFKVVFRSYASVNKNCFSSAMQLLDQIRPSAVIAAPGVSNTKNAYPSLDQPGKFRTNDGYSRRCHRDLENGPGGVCFLDGY